MLTQLHPEIARAARPSFTAGDYEAAVHMAFRCCEDALRGELGEREADLSVLAKRWFTPESRGLAPWALERELTAFRNLWIGAFGALRNPLAHRPAPMSATEAFAWLSVTHLMLTLLRARPDATAVDLEPDVRVASAETPPAIVSSSETVPAHVEGVMLVESQDRAEQTR
jgi:hypothetical protein